VTLIKRILTVMICLCCTLFGPSARANSALCRSLFSPSASWSQNRTEAPLSRLQVARNSLETNGTLYLYQRAGLSAFFTKRKPEPLRFDLVRFRAKRDEYFKLLLTNQSVSTNETPKNLEEKLALLEAITQLNPDTAGIEVIKDWLVTASAKNAAKLNRLLNFKGNETPTLLYKKIAKMYFLLHAPKESFNYILTHDMNQQAIDLIVRENEIAVLHETIVQAMTDLGYLKPSGLKSKILDTYENYETAFDFGFNFLLGSLEVYMFQTPIFANPFVEFKFTKKAVARLSPDNRIRILTSQDFSSLPRETAIKLTDIGTKQIAWRGFLRLASLVGIVWMMYLLQKEFLPDLSSNSSDAERAKLERDNLKIWENNTVNLGIVVTEDLRNDQREVIHNKSDADLKRSYHPKPY